MASILDVVTKLVRFAAPVGASPPPPVRPSTRVVVDEFDELDDLFVPSQRTRFSVTRAL